MKKLLASVSALAILCCAILALPLTAGADGDLSVRLLNDFETETVKETNSKVESTGGQTNGFEQGGYGGSVGLKMSTTSAGYLVYTLYSYGSAQTESAWRDNWAEAQYLQFWVKNTGAGSLTVDLAKLKGDSGTLDHYENCYITEAAQFTASEDGETWTNLEKQLNGNERYEVIVPGGFTGYVRLALNGDNLARPADGWGTYDGQIGQLQVIFGANNTTAYVDDFALVGAFTDTVTGYQMTEEAYIAKGAPIAEETVRLLNDFEAATLEETNSKNESSSGQANSFEKGGFGGSTALKMSTTSAGYLVYTVYSYSAAQVGSTWRDDWTEAEYLQFYVKNEGTGNLTMDFSSLKKDSGCMDHWQEYDITESVQFLASTDTKTWTNLEKQLNGNERYEVIIPGGFTGYVRFALNSTNLSFPNTDWGIYDGQVGKLQVTFGTNNTTAYVDDFALVSSAFTGVIEGYQYSLVDYLAGKSVPDEGGDGVTADADDIRVLQDFTETSRTEANAALGDTSGQANSFAEGGVNGSVALKMETTSAGYLKYTLYSYDRNGNDTTWRDDWQEAEYLQFYAKNTGTGTATMCISSMKKDSGAITGYQDFQVTADAQFITSVDGVNWTNLDKALNGNGLYEITIPAGFDGYIRVAVNATNFAFPNAGWGNYEGQIGHLQMTFGVSNTTLFIDDVALAGNFANTVDGQTTAKAYFNIRKEVEMPTDLDNIRTMLGFEKGVADIGSGINLIPVTLSQSNEWASAGEYSLKLVGKGEGATSPFLSQIQPVAVVGDASTAQYLEMAVNNPSEVAFGITWMNLNGSSVSADSVEISYQDGDKWYAVEAYDDESFAIPAGYEGKIRIKLGTGGVLLMETLITKFEFAVKEITSTAGATLYIDTVCLIGEPLPPVVYTEVTMPTDLDVVKNVMDFESVNVQSIGSGLNFLPVTFSLGTEVADSGNALVVTTTTGGGAPNLSQIQPAKFYQNWTGGQYLEMWISNPNDLDFAMCWCYINGASFNNSDTEISLQFEDGKWYQAQTQMIGDNAGVVIPAEFTGRVRIKLDSRFGDLVTVDNMEFALWCAVDYPGQNVYIDTIQVLGDIELHDEPEVPNAITEFPVEKILEKIANGETYIHYQVVENIPVPTEVLEAIKGTDVVFSYSVLSDYGVELYRWTLVGKELTDVTAFYPQVTMEPATLTDGAMVKPFTVADGDVAGAYLSMQVKKDFPVFADLFNYDEEKVLVAYGDQVSEKGWYTVQLAEDGDYLLTDTLLKDGDNGIYEEDKDPGDNGTNGDDGANGDNDSGNNGTDTAPSTGDTALSLTVATVLLLCAAGVVYKFDVKKGMNER